MDCEVPRPWSFVRLIKNRISNLDRLTQLRLAWDMKSSLKDGSSITLVLSHLPSTLQDLDIAVIDLRESWDSNFSKEEVLVEEERWNGVLPLQPRDHKALRSLRLLLTLFYDPKDSLQWFLAQCPNLLSLGLGSSRTVPAVHRALTNTLKTGACAHLSSLDVAERDLDQSGLITCLDLFAPGQLKALSWTRWMTPVTERIWSSINRHGPFLESLTLNTERLESGIIRTILSTFQRLEHLVVNPSVNHGKMYLEHLRTISTWPCFRTLKSLSLQFQGHSPAYLSSSTDFTDIDTSWVSLYRKAHPDVLRLYGFLSNLTQLASLLIGVKHGHSFAHYTEVGLVGFDFSLQSGLPILKTLKNLRSLRFYQKYIVFDPWNQEGGDYGLYEPQIGPEEAKWMIQHWPCLTEIRQLGVEKGPGVKVRAAREAARAATRTVTEIEAKIEAVEESLHEGRDKATQARAEAETALLELEKARTEALHAVNQALAQAAEKAGDKEVGPSTNWRLLKLCFPEREHVTVYIRV